MLAENPSCVTNQRIHTFMNSLSLFFLDSTYATDCFDILTIPPLFVYLFCRCSVLIAQKMPVLTYLCVAFVFIINFLITCPLSNFCDAKYGNPFRD